MLTARQRSAIIAPVILAAAIGCSSSTQGVGWGGQWSLTFAPKVTAAGKVTVLRSCARLQRHASFSLDTDGTGILLAHQPLTEKTFTVLLDCLLSSTEITRVSDAL
jgi:hypothetical protein